MEMTTGVYRYCDVRLVFQGREEAFFWLWRLVEPNTPACHRRQEVSLPDRRSLSKVQKIQTIRFSIPIFTTYF